MTGEPQLVVVGRPSSEWWGIDRGGWLALVPVVRSEAEMRSACEALGVVLCTCSWATSWDPERPTPVIYRVECPVHHGERRGVRYR